jgi:hypothetical protein
MEDASPSRGRGFASLTATPCFCFSQADQWRMIFFTIRYPKMADTPRITVAGFYSVKCRSIFLETN